jgi:hypothetical protein
VDLHAVRDGPSALVARVRPSCCESACVEAGRRYLGIELGGEYAAASRARIEAV